jgi:hypothetical protein
MKNITRLIIMLSLAFGLLMVVLSSCTDTSETGLIIVRARCLESNTITYVRYPRSMSGVYKCDDTVWVKMITHTISDTDTTTQKCVLIK